MGKRFRRDRRGSGHDESQSMGLAASNWNRVVARSREDQVIPVKIGSDLIGYLVNDRERGKWSAVLPNWNCIALQSNPKLAFDALARSFWRVACPAAFATSTDASAPASSGVNDKR